MREPQTPQPLNPSTKSFNMKLHKLCTLLLLLFICPSAYPQYQGSSNIQFLYGRSLVGSNPHLATITLEHAARWGGFDHFGFADIMDYQDDYFDIYFEYFPKYSISSLFNTSVNFGPVSDVLLGAGLNGLFLNLDNFFVYLAGPVLQFDIPAFSVFQLEAYYYHHLGTGQGFQLTCIWDAPIELGSKLVFRTRGFIDYIGAYSDLAAQLITQPQLLFDVGNLWNAPDRVFVGSEWRHWQNHQGLSGASESILQWNILFSLAD